MERVLTYNHKSLCLFIYDMYNMPLKFLFSWKCIILLYFTLKLYFPNPQLKLPLKLSNFEISVRSVGFTFESRLLLQGVGAYMLRMLFLLIYNGMFGWCNDPHIIFMVNHVNDTPQGNHSTSHITWAETKTGIILGQVHIVENS